MSARVSSTDRIRADIDALLKVRADEADFPKVVAFSFVTRQPPTGAPRRGDPPWRSIGGSRFATIDRS